MEMLINFRPLTSLSNERVSTDCQVSLLGSAMFSAKGRVASSANSKFQSRSRTRCVGVEGRGHTGTRLFEHRVRLTDSVTTRLSNDGAIQLQFNDI